VPGQAEAFGLTFCLVALGRTAGVFEVLLGGLMLGGMYGLVALGLNLQYGVSRILNLAFGEFLIGGAFVAFFTVMGRWQLNPLLSLFASVPIAFALNWLIYRLLMLPLVKRAPDQDALDADVVLVTFGLFFVMQGLALVTWSGDLRGYSFLAEGRNVFGAVVALNRLVAFLGACGLALALFVVLRHTRVGAALRAITIDPVAAELMGVDVRRFSALAFAAGGALAATAGMLVSTFISFSATTGVEYTLKALIVVIMAGVGRVTGTLAAGLLLGVVEQMGGYLVDPGLTLAINFGLFTLILLLRPTGLFTRA
jgi:branched-chain amino acid transport system permease protein